MSNIAIYENKNGDCKLIAVCNANIIEKSIIKNICSKYNKKRTDQIISLFPTNGRICYRTDLKLHEKISEYRK